MMIDGIGYENESGPENTHENQDGPDEGGAENKSEEKD